jgi:hypothetical protein
LFGQAEKSEEQLIRNMVAEAVSRSIAAPAAEQEYYQQK